MPGHEQDRADGGQAVLGSEHELGRAEADGATEHEQQPRPADRREDHRPAERAGAEHGGDQPERARSLIERQLGDERQQDVEIERERRDEQNGEERDGDAARADGERERLADAGQHAARAGRRGEAGEKGAWRGSRRSRPRS